MLRAFVATPVFALLMLATGGASADSCQRMFNSGFELGEQGGGLVPGCASLSGFVSDRSGSGSLFVVDVAVRVSLVEEPSQVYASTRSDGHGRYRLPALPLNRALIVAVEPEGLSTGSSGQALRLFSQSRQIVLGAEAETRMDFSLGVATENSFDPDTAVRLTASGSGDPAQPGAAEVDLLAGALARDDGSAPLGGARAFIQPIDVSRNESDSSGAGMDVFPGNMNALGSNGSGTDIVSFGAMSVEFFDGEGAPLNLAAGQTAQVRIPVPEPFRAAALEQIPLWWFDVARGLWVEEGSAVLSDDRSYYGGSVAHFTAWNADVPTTVAQVAGRVEYADGSAVVGAMLLLSGVDYSYRMLGVANSTGVFALRARRGFDVDIEVVAPGYRQAFAGIPIADADEVDIGVLTLAGNALPPGDSSDTQLQVDILPGVMGPGNVRVYLVAGFVTTETFAAGDADLVLAATFVDNVHGVNLAFPYSTTQGSTGGGTPSAFNYGLQRIDGATFESLTEVPESGYMRDCMGGGDPNCSQLPAPYALLPLDQAVYAVRNRAGYYGKVTVLSAERDIDGNWLLMMRHGTNLDGGRTF